MNDFDKNFHLNMSPLYATFVFMCFMLWASEVQGDDKVIGETYHGHTVLESDLESIQIAKRYVTGFKSTGDDKSIIVQTKDWNEDRIDYKLILSGCWDIDWSFQLQIDGFSPFYIEVGDKILYRAIGQRQNFPCTIIGIELHEVVT